MTRDANGVRLFRFQTATAALSSLPPNHCHCCCCHCCCCCCCCCCCLGWFFSIANQRNFPWLETWMLESSNKQHSSTCSTHADNQQTTNNQPNSKQSNAIQVLLAPIWRCLPWPVCRPSLGTKKWKILKRFFFFCKKYPHFSKNYFFFSYEFIVV